MVELGVNIDHVATLRQARGGKAPDLTEAARQAVAGGADSITIHLREDRRHIQDQDVWDLRRAGAWRLNLEMSLSDPILQIALEVHPDQATLVPEKRQEITTEGGLDLLEHAQRALSAVKKLRQAGIFVSAFIDPDPAQVKQAKTLGFQAVELHTGAYSNALPDQAAAALSRLQEAGALAVEAGLRLHAGHGLNYQNTPAVARIPHMHELNIGHAVVSRAIFTGLQEAVRQMKKLIAL